MAILEWGTYNGKNKLFIAELIGMRLTEIPPYDFSRKQIDNKYFEEYKELSKPFSVVTAHAPYYSTTSENLESLEKTRKALVQAAQRAELANAQYFNLHLGGKLSNTDKSIQQCVETLNQILDATENITLSLETTYSDRYLGSLDEIEQIMKDLGSDRVIVSLQLENDWFRENQLYKLGNLHKADMETTTEFWVSLLNRALKMNKERVLSLRFAQIVGLKIRGLVLKKRVPLGKGYPNLDVLAQGIAEVIVNKIYRPKLDTQVQLIYTGRPETKYKDTTLLYSKVAEKIAMFLEK